MSKSLPESGPQRGVGRTLAITLLSGICGLVLGAGVVLGGHYLEGNGPHIGPFAFNGDGSLVLPFLVGPLGLVVGGLLLGRARAWVALVVFIVAFIVGFEVFNVLTAPCPMTGCPGVTP